MTATYRPGRGLRTGLLLLLLSGLLRPLGAAAQAAAPAAAARTFDFDYQTTVAVPAGAGVLELWLPLPAADAAQDIQGLRVTCPYPYELRTGQYGNQLLHLRLAAPPAAPLVVSVQYRVTRRPSAGTPAADPDLLRWLAPDRLVPLDDSICARAQRVAAGARSQPAQARAVYEHVVGTVRYDKTGQGWGRGDIHYACDARRGNCTDFHSLFIGYCRALGIPARFSIGFPLPPARGQGQVQGYHCWAEFYTPATGWVPVDASEAAKHPVRRGYYFGHLDADRVALSRGRDLTLTPPQRGEPLNYFVYPYAEVDGRAFDGLKNEFRYRDAAE